MKDKGGDLEFVGAVTDITKRKTTEEDLRSSEGYLAEAQKMSQTAVGPGALRLVDPVTGRRSVIVFWVSIQPMACPTAKTSFSRFILMTDPGSGNWPRRLSARRQSSRQTTASCIRDGRIRDIHVIAHPVLSTSSELVEFVGTVIDVH